MSVIKIPKSIRKLTKNYFADVKIPKIIHQTYKSLQQLPEVWQNTPTKWQEHHPDWTYHFWSDFDGRELIKNEYPWFLRIYDAYEYPIQRADAIRYFILYHFGGLYVDCDIQPIRAFDDLFYQDFDVYLIRSPACDSITNCLMASKKGVLFWNYMFKILEENYRDPGWYDVSRHWHILGTTGPLALQDCVKKYPHKELIGMLPRELLTPTCCNICTEKPCQAIGGYTNLLEGSSWITTDTNIYNFIFCKYPYIIAFIFIVLIFIVVRRYYKK